MAASRVRRTTVGSLRIFPPAPNPGVSRGASRTLHHSEGSLHGGAVRSGQATPAGRNWTLTRGPTGLAVFGMQCSQVR